jgi:hypothetical protein
MQHPLVLIIPPLMLLDYFLTVVGARLREGGYAEHFKFPDYETNPMFRDVIRKKKWISLKHLCFVALATAACLYWAHAWQGDDPVSEAIFGGVLILFSTIDGFHVSNILTFHWLLRRPDQVTGEVFMTQRYVVHLTRCRTFAMLFPIVVAAALVPSPFLLGGVASVFSLIVGQSFWAWRDSRREKGVTTGLNTSNS